MNQPARQPQRTCIGCRQSLDQKSLVRFVRSPDGLVLADLQGRLPGRGAYLCWSVACIDAVLKRRQFERTFRQPCQTVSRGELVGQIRQGLLQHMARLIGMARKAAQMTAGSNAVLDALHNPGRFALIILATDVSAGIAEKVRRKAAHAGVECIELFAKAELGQLAGRSEHSVLGLNVGQLAEAFVGDLHKYRDISGEI